MYLRHRRRRTDGSDRQWYLYRYYDRDRRLLYLGKSYDPDTRKPDHATKLWWREVYPRGHCYVETLEFGITEDDAYRLEAAAIRAEKPIWNDAHNWLMAGARHNETLRLVKQARERVDTVEPQFQFVDRAGLVVGCAAFAAGVGIVLRAVL